MKTKQEQKKANMKKAAVIAGFFLLFAVAVYFIGRWDNGKNDIPPIDNSSSQEVWTLDGTNYLSKENMETVLVVGLDKFEDGAVSEGYRNPNCADFIVLLAVDHDAKSYQAIQINRDTYTDVEVITVNDKNYTTKMQIALSHTYGNGTRASLNNTANAVSNLLCDVGIDKSISVKLDAVPIINDMVDGVTVKVLDDFTNLDPSLVQDKEVTLNGNQALLYVRAREGMEDSSNIHRMERQRQYLNALYEKTVQEAKKDDGFVIKVMSQISSYMEKSNCVDVELTDLFNKLSDYEFQGIVSLEGESKKGEKYMEFYPNEKKLQSLVAEVFFVKQ